MGIAGATDEFATAVHQPQHVVDGQHGVHFVGGEDEDDLAGAGLDAGPKRVDDLYAQSVVDGAHVGKAGAHGLDHRNAVVRRLVMDVQDLMGDLDHGAEDLEHDAQVEALVAHRDEDR